jgi:ribosome-binding protein aMBF1 (putative translation factor)
MNTKSNHQKKIKEVFDQLLNSFTEEEKIESDARLIMFRFLDIIERKREQSGWTRKQLAKQVGTSASYITQLFRGDKLINMITLAKFQKVLNFEFDIVEIQQYEEKIKEFSPISDGEGIWVYRKFRTPDYNSTPELPSLNEESKNIA